MMVVTIAPPHVAASSSHIACHMRRIIRKTTTEANALGIRVIPWIVNEPEQMHRLVRMGVAGIITDYPDRLRRILAANHVRLPPRVSIS